MNIFAIAVFAAIGGVLRLWCDASLLPDVHSTVLSCLMINMLGSFVLGFVQNFLPLCRVPNWLVQAVSVGLLGGFTTFSSLEMALLRLCTNQPLIGISFLFLSMILALFAVIAGEFTVKLPLWLARHRLARREESPLRLLQKLRAWE